MGTIVPLREPIPQRQTPRRRPNAELRTREHLTAQEVERLIEAARQNRHGHRDATMILVAFRHGLRASELVDLRWDQVDFDAATLHVRRVKAGTPSTHPLTGLEMRALRRLQRESAHASLRVRFRPQGAVHDRRLRQDARARRRGRRPQDQGAPAHAAPRLRLQARQRWRRYARAAGLPRPQNIQHTVRYTELAPTRFKNFWRD